MSAVRPSFTSENFHILFEGQCENTFIKYVCLRAVKPIDTTNIEKISQNEQHSQKGHCIIGKENLPTKQCKP